MSATLLTAHQVRDLLDVDASTVYRMAGDGRLPAVRIGRQWRFPAEEIEAMLLPRSARGVTDPPVVPAPQPAAQSAAPHRATSTPLPPGLVTTVLETVAPVLGVSMVVTDIDGWPLAPVVNPAPAIAARIDDPAFLAACTADWRGFAGEPHLAPRLRPGRFGFLCAHSLVRHGPSLIAMVLAGGIAPGDSEDPELFHLDADRRQGVLETLPRVAALLSHLAVDGPHPTDPR
jgi:excisionase family DNA binding protein